MNRSKIITPKRIFGIIVFVLALLYASDYFLSSPLERVIKQQILKHPLSLEIFIEKALLERFPLGTDRDYLLNEIQKAGFQTVTNSEKDGKLKSNQESYASLKYMRANFFLSAVYIFAGRKATLVVDFEDKKLSEFKGYIFLMTL